MAGATFMGWLMLLFGTSRMSASGPPAASMNALYISGPCAPPPTAMTVPFGGPTFTAPVRAGSGLYGGGVACAAAIDGKGESGRKDADSGEEVALFAWQFPPEDRPVRRDRRPAGGRLAT